MWGSPRIVFGASIFLLYVNDLSDSVESTTPGFYAEYTQIYTSPSNFNELVSKLNQDLKNIH